MIFPAPAVCARAIFLSRALITAVSAAIILSAGAMPALSAAPDATDTVIVTGTRMSGLSDTGANDYAITAQTIANLPAG